MPFIFAGTCRVLKLSIATDISTSIGASLEMSMTVTTTDTECDAIQQFDGLSPVLFFWNQSSCGLQEIKSICYCAKTDRYDRAKDFKLHQFIDRSQYHRRMWQMSVFKRQLTDSPLFLFDYIRDKTLWMNQICLDSDIDDSVLKKNKKQHNYKSLKNSSCVSRVTSKGRLSER